MWTCSVDFSWGAGVAAHLASADPREEGFRTATSESQVLRALLQTVVQSRSFERLPHTSRASKADRARALSLFQAHNIVSSCGALFFQSREVRVISTAAFRCSKSVSSFLMLMQCAFKATEHIAVIKRRVMLCPTAPKGSLCSLQTPLRAQ